MMMVFLILWGIMQNLASNVFFQSM